MNDKLKTVTISVDFDVQVPESMTEADVDDITFEIPYENIVVFGGAGVIEEAIITGYTTQEYFG